MTRHKLWKHRLLALATAFSVTTGMLPAQSLTLQASTQKQMQSAKSTSQTSEITMDSNQVNASGYELQNDVQGSNILHCWNWSYATIEAHMQLIAECGYTAIQTSPAQQPKDYNCSYLDATGNTVNQTGDSAAGSAVGIPGQGGTGNWWKLYQPVTFNVCDNGLTWLGSKAELESMCATAEKYGIKVIVDIVANHMGNIKGWQNALSDVSPQVGDYWNKDMLTNESYWHINKLQVWMSDGREDFTQGTMGMPDLNTANKTVQKYVYDYLDELIDCGVDGFRFDAAKHIETPEDSASFASDFWPTVLNEARSHYTKRTGGNLYVYGEILNTVGDGFDISNYTKRMSVTDNSAGNHLLDAFRNNNANCLSMDYPANVSVLWAESHDTYMNESSRDASDKSIVRTWAIVGNKKDAASLFFARPYYSSQLLEGDRDNSRKSNLQKELVQATMGECSTYVWASKEVAAINHFNNRFASATDNTNVDGNIVSLQRGDGIILVDFNGAESVSISAHGLANGSYVDEVSGETFQVSNGTISGNIKSEYGIAVIYKNVVGNPSTSYPISLNKPQISASTGNKTITGPTQVTFTAKNATSATYRVDNGTETAFTDSISLTLGENLAVGDKTTVTITAKNADGTTSQTFTYTMGEDKPVLSISPDTEETFTDTLDVTVTADNVTAATYTIGNNAAVAFSGTKTFTIGDNMEEGESITITVTGTDNKGNQETITATFTKEEQNTGSCVYFKNTDNWQQVFCYAWNSATDEMIAWPGTAMKVYDETNQIYVLQLDKNYKNIIFTNNQGTQTKDLAFAGFGQLYDASTGLWTMYESVKPSISCSKASGTISKATEVTIKVKNGETASYQLDQGEQVTFTDSATVTIGADFVSGQQQTLTVTATNGSQTVTKTYTYTMQGVCETETPASSKPSVTTSAETTATPFVTNTATTSQAPDKTPGVSYGPSATPIATTSVVTGSQTPASSESPVKSQSPIASSTANSATPSTTTAATHSGQEDRTQAVSTATPTPVTSIAPTATTKSSSTINTGNVANTNANTTTATTTTTSTNPLKAILKVSKKLIKLGKKLIFTANASGGTPSYQYRYVIYQANGKKVKTFTYSSKKKLTWKPTKKGVYKVVLTVKDKNNKIASKTIKNIKIK